MPSEGEGRDASTSQRASKTASNPPEAKREVGESSSQSTLLNCSTWPSQLHRPESTCFCCLSHLVYVIFSLWLLALDSELWFHHHLTEYHISNLSFTIRPVRVKFFLRKTLIYRKGRWRLDWMSRHACQPQVFLIRVEAATVQPVHPPSWDSKKAVGTASMVT